MKNEQIGKLSILLVEDDFNLGSTLKEYLTLHSHHVQLARNYKEALGLLSQNQNTFQVALLDIGLPDGDGIELAKQLKIKSPNCVFMFLSAQNDPDIKEKALDIGAQDYMTKPFNLKELSFRLKRITLYLQESQKHYQFGDLEVWFDRYQVKSGDGKITNIGLKECEILKLLIDQSPNAVSRDEIISAIWGKDASPSYRTVDNYIVTLRKWTETDQSSKISIESVRGVGYKLVMQNE